MLQKSIAATHATLSHSHGDTLSLPNFISLFPPQTLCFASLLSHQNTPSFQQFSRRLPAICASMKNPRIKSRKVRSNEDLCNDIREFVSQVGLPEGHVPSLKEFLHHGRQDLANIVRRRGYKLVRELLATSIRTTISGSVKEEDLTGKQEKASADEEESTGQNENANGLAECVSLSNEVPIMEEQSSSENIDSDDSCIFVEDSTKPSLLDKVVKFIQNGELETIEDNGLDIVNESLTEDDKEFSESHIPTEPELRSVSEEQSDQVLCRTGTAKVLNGSSLSFQRVVASTSGNGTSRKDSSNDQLISADSDKDVDVETRTKEGQIEVNRIKFMLHQKELELSHLKQQIEKEKQALAELQTKAETEIRKAQKLVSDKDAELHAAEESLSGLKQVHIEYWGEGETVEVAGSFNGWHDRVKMDPQPSSNIADPVGSRNSRLWRSVLSLYPGIYEIKFIVDGKWMIDPMKESVTRGTIHNNILQVDR